MNLIIIIKNNLKKKKADMIVLFLLVVLATLLLYTGISVLFNMDNAMDKSNELTNGSDFTLITASAYPEEILDLLKKREEVNMAEMIPSIYLTSFEFYKEDSQETNQMDFVLEDIAASHSISQVIISDKGDKRKDNSIILPYYMKSGLGYETGDSFFLRSGEMTFEFEVYGFTESVIFSTPSNISVFKGYVTNAFYKKLENISGAGKAKTFHVKLKEGYRADEFDDAIMSALGDEIPDFQNLYNLGVNYESMKTGTSLTITIIMGVVAVFAVVLIVIAMVVIRFSIHNAIEGNLKNIGMLQANGYTSGQLIFVTILETLGITIVGMGIGLLSSLVLTPFVGNIVASSVGLHWQLGFDRAGAVVSCVIVFVLVLLITAVTSGKYKKITPLDALREGIHTHNFRRNGVALHKTGMPLNLALGMKNILAEKKKNAAICLIGMILSFACYIGFFLYDNFVASTDKLIEISGLETPIAMIMLNGKIEEPYEEIGEKIKKITGTDDISYATSSNVVFRYGDIQMTSYCEMFDDPGKLRTNILVEGRMPKYDNELLLTALICDTLGVSLGDVVYVEMNGKSEGYVLTGIGQGITRLGRKGILTLEGAERLNPNIHPSFINIYGKEGIDFKELEKEYRTIFPEITLVNVEDSTQVSLASISNMMKLICILFVICTLLVVIMVIFFLVKAKLIRERRTMGVYKALGFTTGQLIVQTVMSYVPVISTGTVISAVIAYFTMNPLLALCLSFGIKRCNLDVEVFYMIGTAIGIVGAAAVVAVLCSLKIRKIQPCRMIQE